MPDEHTNANRDYVAEEMDYGEPIGGYIENVSPEPPNYDNISQRFIWLVIFMAGFVLGVAAANVLHVGGLP